MEEFSGMLPAEMVAMLFFTHMQNKMAKKRYVFFVYMYMFCEVLI